MSIRYTTIDLDTALPPTLYRREPLPWEAAFSQESASFSTAVVAEAEAPLYPTFISAHTRQSVASPSSRVMLRAITRIFQNSRSSLPLPRVAGVGVFPVSLVEFFAVFRTSSGHLMGPPFKLQTNFSTR